MNRDVGAAIALAAILACGAVAGYWWAVSVTPYRRARRAWQVGPVRGRGRRYWTVRVRLRLAPGSWARWWRGHPELEGPRRISAEFRRAVARVEPSPGGLARIRARIARRPR